GQFHKCYKMSYSSFMALAEKARAVSAGGRTAIA
ncbi:hypothetical protein F442_00808, partial [Phytophthora nicotianae P10297]